MDFLQLLPAWVIGLITLFLLFTAVLWALLPFAVFGIKERLDHQLESLRSIDERLRAQSVLLARIEESINKRQ